MALWGVLEVALHVVKFENIELPRFGSYSIRFRLYKRCHLEVVPAVPYMIKTKDECHSPAWIDDINQSFVTREIIIYKANQNVFINDICQFRMEIPATPSVLERTNLFLECDLFYTVKDKDNSFKSFLISSKLIRLNDTATGFRQNFDLIFGDFYVSTVHLNINSAVLHYRIRNHLKNIVSASYEPGKCFKRWETLISKCSKPGLARWFSQPDPVGQNFYYTFDKEYDIESIYTTNQLLDSFINYLCLDIKLSEMSCRRIFSLKPIESERDVDKNLLLEYERNYYTCKDFTCFTLRLSFMKDDEDKVRCCPATKNVVKSDENSGLVYSNNLMFSYIMYSKLLGEALAMLGTFSDLPSGTYVQFDGGKFYTISAESVYHSNDTNMFNNDALGRFKEMIDSVLEEGEVKYAACGTGQVVVVPLKVNGIKIVIPSIDLLAVNNDLDRLCNEIESNLWNISSLLFFKWNEFLDNQLNRTDFKRYRMDEDFFISLASRQRDHTDLEGILQSLPVVDDCHIYALISHPLFSVHPFTHLKGTVSTDSFNSDAQNLSMMESVVKCDSFSDDYTQNESCSFISCSSKASEAVRSRISSGRANRLSHLFILVHGYNAGPRTMQIIKNMITVIFPDSVCLSSCFNQSMGDVKIAEMGENLATEVKMYIKYCMPISKISKISFIVHSMGGLVARSALCYLSEYSHLFHGFISLASAHIGYLYNSSKLIDLGLWFLKKMKNSHCIKELALSDSSEMTETYLYQLSCLKGIDWFKYVILLACDLDQYAPFYSARIDTGRIPTSDVRQIEMACNILNNIKYLIRIDCSLSEPLKHVKGWTGKTAHLEFVESVELIRALLYTISKILSE